MDGSRTDISKAGSGGASRVPQRDALWPWASQVRERDGDRDTTRERLGDGAGVGLRVPVPTGFWSSLAAGVRPR